MGFQLGLLFNGEHGCQAISIPDIDRSSVSRDYERLTGYKFPEVAFPEIPEDCITSFGSLLRMLVAQDPVVRVSAWLNGPVWSVRMLCNAQGAPELRHSIAQLHDAYICFIGEDEETGVSAYSIIE